MKSLASCFIRHAKNPLDPLDQLDLTTIDPAYGPDAKGVFSLETALVARTNPGAPSIANVTASTQILMASPTTCPLLCLPVDARTVQ